MDGLDAAAVRIHGTGYEITAELLATASKPFESIADLFRVLADERAVLASQIVDASAALGEMHADVIEKLLADSGVGAPDLIALHGQTVFHRPPLSWQLVNPWPVTRVADCPIVFDMRGADLIHGGQGAPITPIADYILFRGEKESRAIINLGGFCNITILPADGGPADLHAFDVCACNHLLDAVARRALHQPFDEGGAAAAKGQADPHAMTDLISALAIQARADRSLGTGDEPVAWLEAWTSQLAPEDLATTAAQSLARVIADCVKETDSVLCAGGGARNTTLLRFIERAARKPVRTTDELGIPSAHRESAAIAILGALCADGVPITIPGVTGVPAPAPLSGAWINTCPATPQPRPTERRSTEATS